VFRSFKEMVGLTRGLAIPCLELSRRGEGHPGGLGTGGRFCSYQLFSYQLSVSPSPGLKTESCELKNSLLGDG